MVADDLRTTELTGDTNGYSGVTSLLESPRIAGYREEIAMRKGFGIGLTVLGGFLVTLAVLAQFWAPGQLMKTPLDTDSLTLLDGTAQLSDGTGGTSEFPIKAFSVTRADSERSDGDVVVFQNSSCLVKDEGEIDECVSASDPEERLISAGTDNFATDRRDGMAVNDPKYLPPSAEDKEGLVNKWPFEAEKTSPLLTSSTAPATIWPSTTPATLMATGLRP